VPLHITAAPDTTALLDLPWSTPLAEWPQDQLVALPRGISRHVVRFVRLSGRIYAVKEIGQRVAEKEYRLLRELERLDVPAVEAVGVVGGRTADSGEPVEPALVTRHLQFSLPYRALFSQTLRPDTANRLLDALAVLLVRLHLVGFYWGDCSLSNTLFRRDAGAFAAYLVDAETGELRSTISEGQRRHDIDIARTNIFGELLDLQAGGFLDESMDPVDTSADIVDRYEGLWSELTRSESVGFGQRWAVDQRLRRLNDLGFDVAELQVVHQDGEQRDRVMVQPKVVDAGHHSRRLLRLTGIDVQENQARRLLNDLDCYRAAIAAEDPELADDEEIVAHRWVTEAFQPVVRTVPRELRGKLEPAEIFHEVLEHRWYLSETAGRDVGLDAAVRSYVNDVLVNKPDEHAVVGSRLSTAAEGGDLSGVESTAELRLTFPVDD